MSNYMFKKQQRHSKPIGRRFQFNDPLRNSNKKHFWMLDDKDYGLLTTQQLNMLNQQKQQQKWKIHGQNYHKNYQRYSTFDISESKLQNMNKSQIQSKRHSNRIKSEALDYIQQQKDSYINKSQSTNKIISQSNTKQEKQKVIRQDNNYYEFIKQQNKNRIHMDLGNINIKLPPSIVRKEKAIFKPYFQNKYSYHEQSKKNLRFNTDNSDNPQHFHYQLKKKLNMQLPSIYPVESRKLMPINTKQFLKTKLRRDYSPTYCNSLNYPLKCYRYV